MNKLFRNKPLLLACGILVFYFLPFIFSGQNSNIIIHDNLDGNFVQYVVLAREGKTISFNADTRVEPIMNGMPRMFCINGLNINACLFLVFQPFTAWLINFMAVHGIAFVGMLLLLRKHFLRDKSDDALAVFVALAFALIPFYTIFGLAVAGTPLLLFSFANLATDKKAKFDYLIIVLFAFYSSLVLVGIFVIFCLLAWGVYDYLKSRRINKTYLKGILILGASYSIINVMVFYQFFVTRRSISHRVDFMPEKFDFATVIDNAYSFFNSLHYHVSSPLVFLFVLIVLAIIFGVVTKHEYTRLLALLVLANVLIAFVFSIASWEMLEGLWQAIPLTKQFQWNRFYYLSPLTWFMQLALSLKIIKDVTRPLNLHNIAQYSAAAYVLFFLWKANTEFRETTNNLFSDKKIGWSYKQFFDEKLFSEIKNYINRPTNQYRVASLGMHPSVSLYNGFFTIDGYLPSYPLSYKKEFRKIIADELEKPNGLKSYFDSWGSRCYLFPSELGYNFTVNKEANLVINDLAYDFNEEPAVHYILSAAEIASPLASNLIYLRSFESPDSRWRIHLYEVRSNLTFNDSNSVQILVNATVEHDDVFQVYYQPVNSEEFSEENSIRIRVKARNEPQQIRFRIPSTVPIKQMRLDVGNNVSQASLKVFDIKLTNGDKTIPVKFESLSPNAFIELRGDQIILKEVGGRYDPYFQFDSYSIAQFNLIGSATVK